MNPQGPFLVFSLFDSVPFSAPLLTAPPPIQSNPSHPPDPPPTIPWGWGTSSGWELGSRPHPFSGPQFPHLKGPVQLGVRRGPAAPALLHLPFCWRLTLAHRTRGHGASPAPWGGGWTPQAQHELPRAEACPVFPFFSLLFLSLLVFCLLPPLLSLPPPPPLCLIFPFAPPLLSCPPAPDQHMPLEGLPWLTWTFIRMASSVSSVAVTWYWKSSGPEVCGATGRK